MRSAVLSCLVVVACVIPGMAQRPSPGSGSGNHTNPAVLTPTPEASSTLYINGRVAIEGGAEVDEPVEVHASCGGQRRAQAFTDWKGQFSFQLTGNSPNSQGISVADASVSGTPMMGTLAEWRSCQIEAERAGFSSRPVELATVIDQGQSVNVGTIFLHPLSSAPGFVLSATSAAAPEAAKKAFAKALEQIRKQKWPEAEKLLQSAVRIYPKYAAAWAELGTVQLQRNEPADARTSFQSSVAADSKFVPPYRGLAELAMRDRKWDDVVDVTGKLLALDPVSFPNAWLYNGAANYNLGNLAAAEKSVRQAVLLDKNHQLPKCEYLLGLILIDKKAYKEAEEHIQEYRRFAANPQDAAEAQRQLDRLATLAATPASSAPQ